MYTEIFIGAAVVLFAILVFFLIYTLIKLQKTLCQACSLLETVELKLNHTDSFLRSLSNLGDICEQKTVELRNQCLRNSEAVESQEGIGEVIAEWLLLTAAISKKLLKRR